MRVLGISPLDKDATASFLEDGRVLFACGEERLSRVKLQDGFPRRAVALGLERLGWDPATIDVVAYGFWDGAGEERLIREAIAADRRHGVLATARSMSALRKAWSAPYNVDRSVVIPGLDAAAEYAPRKTGPKRLAYDMLRRWAGFDGLAHRYYLGRWASSAIADHHLRNRQLDEGLRELGLLGKLKRFAHHDTHAANAFYASGFESALVVTLDGYGSGMCGGVYSGGPEGLKALHHFPFPHSLGQHYENVTSALGFKPGRHEGKIVGLAAYGDARVLRETLRERLVVERGDLRILGGLDYAFTRALATRFAKRDVAAAYQAVLEEVTVEILLYWLEQTGLSRVVLSGGVHANVKLNQRIREARGVKSVFVYPNMGDGGCGTGAAMLAFGHELMRGQRLENVYLGPDFTEGEIASALQREGLAFEQVGAIEDRVADLLAKDSIIGRFTGRMEYGPRALGNRSVLYPAQEPEVNQWLNHQLGRTEFMPFAPAALASEAHRLFEGLEGCEHTAEFMTITFNCTPAMRRLCPAAVHVDGTARPQLVRAETNPSFHRILSRYYSKTGIPAIINTSFNMHEEPIVCTPADAIRAFLLGRLDYLAIGSFLVPHPRRGGRDAGRDRADARRETELVNSA